MMLCMWMREAGPQGDARTGRWAGAEGLLGEGFGWAGPGGPAPDCRRFCRDGSPPGGRHCLQPLLYRHLEHPEDCRAAACASASALV